MLVDLDKVKKIINSVKTGSYYSSGFVKSEILNKLDKLDKLAYGNVYQCLNCNNDIYFDKESNVYKHINNGYISCNGDVNINDLKKKIAIPKPDNNLAKPCEQGCNEHECDIPIEEL